MTLPPSLRKANGLFSKSYWLLAYLIIVAESKSEGAVAGTVEFERGTKGMLQKTSNDKSLKSVT